MFTSKLNTHNCFLIFASKIETYHCFLIFASKIETYHCFLMFTSKIESYHCFLMFTSKIETYHCFLMFISNIGIYIIFENVLNFIKNAATDQVTFQFPNFVILIYLQPTIHIVAINYIYFHTLNEIVYTKIISIF